MSEIINYLLLEQPEDPDMAILHYLEGRRAGAPPKPVNAVAAAASHKSVGMKDRLYMARKVQPILEQLMRRVVDEQPLDVESHFIAQLTRMTGRIALPAQANVVPVPVSVPVAGPVPVDSSVSLPSSPQVQHAHVAQGLALSPAAGVLQQQDEVAGHQGALFPGAGLMPSSSSGAMPSSHTPAAHHPAAEPPAPREMPRPACDALFRMLDESGAGRLAFSAIPLRVRKLHAFGVPIDSVARAFWSAVRSPSSASEQAGGQAGGHAREEEAEEKKEEEDEWLDLDDFYDAMCRVFAQAVDWLPGVQAGHSLDPALVAQRFLQPGREECGYLYRMLDEDRAGVLTVGLITQRMARLRAAGVPLRDSVVRRWMAVQHPMDMQVTVEQFHGLLLEARSNRAGPAPTSHHQAASPLPASSSPSFSPTTPTPAPAAVAAPEEPAKQGTALLCDDDLPVGTRVRVNYHKSGNFFDGQISQVRGGDRFDILYDDNDTEANVERAMIARLGADPAPGAGAGRAANPGDEDAAAPAARASPSGVPDKVSVGMKVTVDYKSSGNWYPGVVARPAAGSGVFDIDYDDGDKEKRVPVRRIKVLGEDGAVVPVPGTAAAPASVTASAPSTTGDEAPQPVPAKQVKPILLLLGNSGVGKSTLLGAMMGKEDPKTVKTMGFTQRHVQYMVDELAYRVQVFDVAGSWPAKWGQYVAEAHGVVYLLDAAADEDAFQAQIRSFGDTRSNLSEHLEGKPMLVMTNKHDQDGARTLEQVAEALNIPVAHPSGPGSDGALLRTSACVAHPKRNGGSRDPRIEAGLDWILKVVVGDFAALDARVAAAKEEAERQRKVAEVERNRRVMVKILKEKAFPADGEEPVECYSLDDGQEFLAMETNLHDPEKPNHGLPDIGAEVARLVGYQKVAMQMCGAMVCPVSKRKVKRTWEEVLAYVKDRREDAGLERDG